MELSLGVHIDVRKWWHCLSLVVCIVWLIFSQGAAATSLEVNAYAKPSVIFDFCYENRALLPYYAGDGEQVPLEDPGLNIEMLRQLDTMLDEITISYQRKPWKNCLASVASGEVSGVIASYYKVRESIGVYPKANGQLDPSRKFSSANYCLYKQPDTSLDYNGEHFTGVGFAPIVVPTGYSVINQLKQQKVLYFEVASSARGFELLLHHQVAAVATLCEVGRDLRHDRPELFGHIIEDQPQLVKRSAYLLVSKQFYRRHAAEVEKMWSTLKSLNP